MKAAIAIFGSGYMIPTTFFPSSGEGYGKEVRGEILGFGGGFILFKPDKSKFILTLPTTHDWVHIRAL